MAKKSNWSQINASVYSVEWVEDSRKCAARYIVTYSYRVHEERYVGKFNDYLKPQDDHLHANDTIIIAYDPDRPADSFYPGAHRMTLKILAFFFLRRITWGLASWGQ